MAAPGTWLTTWVASGPANRSARPVGPAGRAYRWCLRRPLVAVLLALSTVLAIAVVVIALAFDAVLSARAEDERQQIVQLNLTIASRDEESGDTFMAVLRYAEALKVDEAAGVSGRDHRARIAADLRQSPRLVDMQTHDGLIVCTRLTPEGGWLAIAGPDHALALREVRTGRPLGPPLSPAGGLSSGAIGANGELFAAIATDGPVRVWDVPTGRSWVLPLSTLEVPLRLAFPGDGRVLVTQHTAGAALRLWDLTADGPTPMKGPWTDATAHSPLNESGRWLLIQDSAGEGQLWDVSGRSRAGPPLRLAQRITMIQVSPDTHRLVLVGAGETVRIWDQVSGGWLGNPLHPRTGVHRLVFSPDSERLLIVGPNGAAQAWRLRTGEVLDIPVRDGGAWEYTCFSPDSKLLLAGNSRAHASGICERGTSSVRHSGTVRPLSRRRSTRTDGNSPRSAALERSAPGRCDRGPMRSKAPPATSTGKISPGTRSSRGPRCWPARGSTTSNNRTLSTNVPCATPGCRCGASEGQRYREGRFVHVKPHPQNRRSWRLFNCPRAPLRSALG